LGKSSLAKGCSETTKQKGEGKYIKRLSRSGKNNERKLQFTLREYKSTYAQTEKVTGIGTEGVLFSTGTKDRVLVGGKDVGVSTQRLDPGSLGKGGGKKRNKEKIASPLNLRRQKRGDTKREWGYSPGHKQRKSDRDD